ncbi:MAG: PEP-CTERM sorting domain-containing protein [Verrucomicrobiae bacterium]|nr:PEP-CTERM sorting domain-containing protein [Verrucomicrobiae bacterium]
MKINPFLGHFAVNVLLTCSVFGQANFLFRNYGSGINAPVFNAQGQPLGPSYRAELWGAATPDSLTPLLVLDENNRREILPFFDGGYVISTTAYLSVYSVPPGGSAWLQMRAWDAQLGATYEQVAALGIGGYGESPLFYAQGGNPFDQFPEPGHLIGLQSYSLRPIVPEPSTWALFTFGGTALWWAARRHRRRKP